MHSRKATAFVLLAAVCYVLARDSFRQEKLDIFGVDFDSSLVWTVEPVASKSKKSCRVCFNEELAFDREFGSYW